MNERQINLIMEIVREQFDDYLAPELAADIESGISEGINDNIELIDQLAEQGESEKRLDTLNGLFDHVADVTGKASGPEGLSKCTTALREIHWMIRTEKEERGGSRHGKV